MVVDDPSAGLVLEVADPVALTGAGGPVETGIFRGVATTGG